MKAHCMFALAVVLAAPALADVMDLSGTWRFEIAAADAPGYARALPGKITLPGTMDDAGLGPTNAKPATLAGPYRLYDYAGPAWYQRDLEIPEAWAGQRMTLFLERARWVTTVWLDDKRIGAQDSLIAPHVYDLGAGVAPGRHRLTICVDNTVKINLGTFVSALFGGTWGNMNGIIGRIELAATPPVWLDDVQVYPDADKRQARVAVKIGNATGQAGKGRVQVSGVRFQSGKKEPTVLAEVEVNWAAEGGTAETVVELGPEAPLWDEFKPVLQTLDLTLSPDTRALTPETRSLKPHSRSASFGLRQFATRGTQFTLNGRPVYLRGTLECSVWPLTGYPPTDVPAWQRIYRIMKSYGLNHIRFHSWCPPEAAFAAADIEGIMIQAEGPMANVSAGSDPKRDAFIEAEFKRIVDTYGNHPSFCTMTLGNEYGGNRELLTRWVDMLIKRDPRHLYSSASSAQTTANRQFTESPSGRGVHGPGTQHDLRAVVVGDSRPLIGHEIGQWMFFPNFDEIAKYRGVMAVRNFELIRDDLARKNLLDLAPEFAQACGKHAVLLYKEEIELLLRTPGYGGFSLLDLHDYPTQGTALVGPLDAFWDSKGFVTPEAYRRFCGPTVPLLRMPKRTYTTAEAFEGTVDLAHYGPADLPNAQPVWTIRDGKGREVESGAWPALRVRTGKLTTVGTLRAVLAKAAAPGKLTVTVSLKGTDVANDWDLWVYPPNEAVAPPGGVIVSRAWDEATQAALAAGKRVVLFPDKTNRALTLRGSFLPVFWSPVWFPSQQPNANGILCDPRHPALVRFPTEFHSNWQWWEILNGSRTLVLDDTPATFRPIVQVVDNFARNHKLGNLFEARVGAGSLLVCTLDLPRTAAQSPAAAQLLGSLYAYAGSAQFKPEQALDTTLLDVLFGASAPSGLQKLGAKIRADSEAPGYEAALAMDGDPETCWHTAWEPSPKPMPHELVIDFGREVTVAGITYLPRQDMANGRIAACEVFADKASLGVAQWLNTGRLQTLRFPKPVTARALTLQIKSEVNGNPFASAAEVDVLEK